MILYKCCFTNDELFTDSFKVEECDEIFYRVTGRQVTVKAGGDVDPALCGANPSAEEEQEQATEGDTITDVNVAIAHRMSPMHFGDKKEFIATLKSFVKKLKEYVIEKNPDMDAKAFEARLNNGLKKVLKDFADYTFYMGESMEPDANIILCKWEVPEGKTDDVPFMYFFKDSLIEEKC